jgi:hypothetical protein
VASANTISGSGTVKGVIYLKETLSLKSLLMPKAPKGRKNTYHIYSRLNSLNKNIKTQVHTFVLYQEKSLMIP